MFGRLFGAALLLLAVTVSGRAEITNPELQSIAQGYSGSIAPPSGDVSVAETIRRINEARKQGRAVDVVRLSETLVARDDTNAHLWLNLARAWQATDIAANNGLAAAIRAAELSSRKDERLEALLLASAYLRAQLSSHRDRYELALDAVLGADEALAQARGLALDDRFAAPKEDNPEGRIAALERTRDEAVEESAVAAEAIANAATALDEIYREIQSSLPNLNVAEMRGGDERLDFYPVENKSGFREPEYRISGNDVEVCVGFNKPLKENSREYGAVVEMRIDGELLANDAFDVRAQGNELCLLRLEPGLSYENTLLAEFPAADGTMLGEAQTFYITVPDLPARIGFADGEFMLPRSGPGDLPVSLTNVEAFPLAIHRVVDRSLHRHLALGHIRNGIPSTEYQALITQFSEVLWQGAAERPMDEREHNTTVRTFVPVRTILEDRADWLARGDNADWNRQGLLRSSAQPVRGISDPRLDMAGNFVAGPLDVDPAISGKFVPGVYALVAPVPDEGPDKEFHCAGADSCAVYAAQWFVITDIGLTFYEGERDFTVLARSLTTGGPVANARIQLVSKGNRVLAEDRTDANGAVRFDRSLTIGEASNALVAIMAETESDFNFLSYGSERLDLSRLNVGGDDADHTAAGAVLYTDRGIYQPGESPQVLALLANRSGGADAARGVELRLEIADYLIKARPIEAGDWRDGGTLVSFEIPETAKHGTAVLKLVSAANDVMAETAVQIGKIRPDRARITFPTDERDALRVREGGGDTVEITGTVRAQYLYGAEGTGQAPAANLKAEVTVRVAPVATPVDRCYGDLVFGRFDDKSLPTISRNDVFYTNAEGELSLRLSRVRLPATTRPMAATVEVTLFDAAGPVASGRSSVQIAARDAAIGVSAAPRTVLMESGGYRLALDVAAVGARGSAALNRDVEILVERERESYAWENIDGVWQHTQLRQREEVSRSRVRLDRQDELAGPCPGVVTVPEAATGVDDGRYVVTVTDGSGAIASTRFTTGAAQTSVDDLEPNIFVLSSDKERYAPGETVSLSIDAPVRTGEALVAIAAGDIVHWVSGEVRDGAGTVTFTANPAWAGRGFYALATVFKADPGDVRSYGPARAIGAAYFEVTARSDAFALSVRREGASLENFLRPDEPLRFDVCIDGPGGACGAPGMPEAYAVAYVVDEGLLSLTGHASRMARLEKQIIGKARLGVRVMDNYGRLLLKEGGDRPGRLALTNYTSTNIIAAASGPVPLRDGRASFNFDDLELHTGALSIFVVVWSDEHVATKSETLPVRHFIVSSLGTPEFFLAGDRPLLPLRLENISFIDHPGDYRLTFDAEGGIGVGLAAADGSEIAPAADGAFLVKIPQGRPQDLFLRLAIPDNAEGHYRLALDLSAVDAQIPLPAAERRREWRLAVRPSAVAAQEYISFPLGTRETDLAQLLEGLVEDRYDPESVKVVARFAGGGNMLRMASLGGAATDSGAVLDQMIWQGFVDLQMPGNDQNGDARARVQQSVDGIQALQLADGAFVPYRTDGEFMATEIGFDRGFEGEPVRHGLLRNASALDLLIRARNAGYSVSEDAITNSVAFIKGRVADALGAADWLGPDLLCGLDTRYAMLVLVQRGELNAAQVDRLNDCSGAEDSGDEINFEEESEPAGEPVAISAGQSALSDLVTLAVMSEFGEPVDAEDALSAYYQDSGDYFGDLDQYRKAIAVSMLAHTGIREEVLRSLAGSFLADTNPLDLRTRAWLARSVADLELPANAKLAAADIGASDPDLAALTARPDGVVESAEISYLDIREQALSISQTGGAEARAFIRIGGKLLDGQELALPETSIRRRFFHAESGRAFDPASERLEVGDLLVVMLEATPEAFERFAEENYADLGFAYGPLSVQALLPSAFTLVSPDLSAVTPRGELERLALAGNVRAISSGPQSWEAIIVPASSDAVASLDDEEEGGAEAAEDIEFRQAFVVSVSAAGSFLFPATAIDPLDFPGNTLLSQPATLEVDIPSGPGR